MNLVEHKVDLLARHPLVPNQPLWQRVPTRTQSGELTADFMMIIKRLNKLRSMQQERIIAGLCGVLQYYSEVILLADVNMKTNLLWISHVPRPGLGIEIAAMIHHQIPQAKLVGHHSRE